MADCACDHTLAPSARRSRSSCDLGCASPAATARKVAITPGTSSAAKNLSRFPPSSDSTGSPQHPRQGLVGLHDHPATVLENPRHQDTHRRLFHHRPKGLTDAHLLRRPPTLLLKNLGLAPHPVLGPGRHAHLPSTAQPRPDGRCPPPLSSAADPTGE